MYLDVTHMVEDADNMFDLSGSIMEHGETASQFTWGNSVEYGKAHPLLKTDEQRDAARAHFKSYGAWSEEEIAAWSEDRLQGIMCQEVAAAVREMEHYDTEEEYYKAAQEGQVSGNLCKGVDGKWYFYLGS